VNHRRLSPQGRGMSASGHKRTFRGARSMSAYIRKRTIGRYAYIRWLARNTTHNKRAVSVPLRQTKNARSDYIVPAKSSCFTNVPHFSRSEARYFWMPAISGESTGIRPIFSVSLIISESAMIFFISLCSRSTIG